MSAPDEKKRDGLKGKPLADKIIASNERISAITADSSTARHKAWSGYRVG
jgi:hypothetical protein